MQYYILRSQIVCGIFQYPPNIKLLIQHNTVSIMLNVTVNCVLGGIEPKLENGHYEITRLVRGNVLDVEFTTTV